MLAEASPGGRRGEERAAAGAAPLRPGLRGGRRAPSPGGAGRSEHTCHPGWETAAPLEAGSRRLLLLLPLPPPPPQPDPTGLSAPSLAGSGWTTAAAIGLAAPSGHSAQHCCSARSSQYGGGEGESGLGRRGSAGLPAGLRRWQAPRARSRHPRKALPGRLGSAERGGRQHRGSGSLRD